jgi:serine-type D-Ala-D-Ala carboxypeptidase/endopeptidase (penicillin-binding protein 4)
MCTAVLAATGLGVQAAPRADAPPVLPAPMLAALQGSGLPLRSFGLYVRAVDRSRPLAALNAETPYVLASTAKVVTSLAAMDLLGPGYRWRTQAYVTGPIVAGRLLGDLLIVGGGDPRFGAQELRAWMMALRRQGLDEVLGDVLIDRSAFALQDSDHQRTPSPAWDRPHHVRPDAMMIGEGVVHVSVHGTRSTQAQVLTQPPLSGMRVDNRVKRGAGCAVQARWADPGNRPAAPTRLQAYTPPPATQLIVEGRWSPACEARSVALVVPGDADHATHAMAGTWADVGGRLRGRVRSVDLRRSQPGQPRLPLIGPDGEAMLPWATHLSETLPGLVHEMNKTSNNVMARHLMLSLARDFPQQSATLPQAQASVQRWLKRQGLADDIVLENGSGLSRAEQGKPRAMVQMLVNAWRSPQIADFLASLPVAGVDGTLQSRLQNGPATGRAFLKTGTLRDTRALAGYVTGASGTIYALAVLVNHPNAAAATPALDTLVEWLAKNG